MSFVSVLLGAQNVVRDHRVLLQTAEDHREFLKSRKPSIIEIRYGDQNYSRDNKITKNGQCVLVSRVDPSATSLLASQFALQPIRHPV